MALQIGNRHEHPRNTSECEQHRIVEPELGGLELLARERLIARLSLLSGLVDDRIDALRNDRRAKKLKGNKRKKSEVFLAAFGGQHFCRLDSFDNAGGMALHECESVLDVVSLAVESARRGEVR